MQNGSQAPPGISLFAPGYFFTTDTLKNDEGDEFGAHPRINASFVGVGVAWVTNFKLLGGNLGGNVVPVAFMKSRIEANSLEVPGSFAFTDISVTPLQLGWTKPRAYFTLAYTLFVPTGKWEEGGGENSGLGMWSNLIQAGSTLRLDDKHAWTTSLLASYEIHSHKEDSTLKAGDILTLEGGTGKSFFKKVEGTPLPRITTVGLAYYAQLKVSADSGIGPLADRLVAGRKDRVFGLGVEGSVFLAKPKLVLGLRFVPEFGARNRPQGYTFLLTLAYEAKSLVTMPAHP
jgi:hypothetical protein